MNRDLSTKSDSISCSTKGTQNLLYKNSNFHTGSKMLMDVEFYIVTFQLSYLEKSLFVTSKVP